MNTPQRVVWCLYLIVAFIGAFLLMDGLGHDPTAVSFGLFLLGVGTLFAFVLHFVFRKPE